MKKVVLIVGLILVIGIGYWLAAPLFVTNEVQDELPQQFVTNEPDQAPAPVGESFSIIDTPGHPAEGVIRVIDTEEQTLVRFEDYEGTNGPDLFVYLAKDLEATEFVSLGRAKGNMGNINYEVPGDVDISEYQYIMTWCRLFGVLFDYAEINPPQ